MMILQIGLVARLIGLGEASNGKFLSFTLIKAKTFLKFKNFPYENQLSGVDDFNFITYENKAE